MLKTTSKTYYTVSYCQVTSRNVTMNTLRLGSDQEGFGFVTEASGEGFHTV